MPTKFNFILQIVVIYAIIYLSSSYFILGLVKMLLNGIKKFFGIKYRELSIACIWYICSARGGV